MFIYNYCNEAYELNITPEVLKFIYVSVISGDEIITCYFKNGSTGTYDAGKLLHSGRNVIRINGRAVKQYRLRGLKRLALKIYKEVRDMLEIVIAFVIGVAVGAGGIILIAYHWGK